MQSKNYLFKTKERHLDGGHWLWSGMERDGLCHVTLPKTHHMKMTTTAESILARSSTGTWTAPSVAGHQDGIENHVTDGPNARNKITIGTWNVRSLRAAGKVKELTHEMKRYQWNIVSNRLMMTFILHLQRVKNQGSIRIKFSLEKLKDPTIAECFQATIVGKFAPLLGLENQDTKIDALINSFNTAVTETDNNILGKHRPAKPWVNILKLCDKRRELKKGEYD